MNTKQFVIAAFAVLFSIVLQAAVIVYDNNGSGSVHDTTRWIGGIVPGSNDIACVEGSGNVSLSFSQDTQLGGIYIYTSSGTANVSGGGKLYLGRYGLAMYSTAQKTLSGIQLAADQVWTFSGGGANQTGQPTPAIRLNGYNLLWQGAGNKQEIKFAMAGPGTLEIRHESWFYQSNSTLATDIDMIYGRGNTTHYFYSYKSTPGTDSMRSVTANNPGDLRFENSTSANGTHRISGDITINNGTLMSFTSTQKPNYRGLWQANTLVINEGAVFFRGNNFTTINSETEDIPSTGCIFDIPPVLSGQNDGTGSLRPILLGVIVATNNTGASVADGLTTYDTDRGVRPLDPETEYISTITDGSTALDNVRILTTGAGAQNITLADPLTTVNSLSLESSGGANASGITIAGNDGTALRINSGTIFCKQTATGITANDGIKFTIPALDFNGTDGRIFLAGISTSGTTYNTTTWNGPVTIQSIPQNVGPKGIGFYGSGYARITGSQPNTYMGNITVGNGANVQLNRSIPNTAIQSTLTVNGGTCRYSDQLATTADVIVHEGTSEIVLGSGKTGNQTFRDLTVYGGGLHRLGNGDPATSTHRNATLFRGKYIVSGKAVATLTGDLTLAGGLLDMGSASLGSLTVQGATIISNPANYAANATYKYTAANIGRTATLNLGSSLSYYVNEYAPLGCGLISAYTVGTTAYPVIALSGETVFNIEDNSAETDLEIQPSLVDGTIPGRLVKEGPGVLGLSAPTNSLTGGIDLNAGGITLVANTTLCGINAAADTLLRVEGSCELQDSLTFAEGSQYAFNTNGVLTLSGSVTAAAPVPVDCAIPTNALEKVLVMTAAGGINGKFISPNSQWVFNIHSGNRLVLQKNIVTKLFIQ